MHDPLIEALPCLAWIAGEDGRRTAISRRCREYAGLDAADAEGRSWFDEVHPDDRAAARAGWAETIDGVAPRDLALRLRRADGTFLWHALTLGAASPGAPPGLWCAVAVDVDAIVRRARSNATATPVDGRFREMADAAPAILWTTEVDGTCSFLSRGWYELTGQTEAEALGTGWLEAVHPDDREASAAAFAGAITNSAPFALDHRVRRHDGTYRWVLDAGRPRFSADGRFIGHIGSVIDVHERTEAEGAFRERERRLRQMADAMPQIVWTAQPDGQTDYFNRRWYDLTGAAQVGDGDERWLEALHPDDRERTHARWQLSVENGEPYEIEYRLRSRHTGGYRWHLGRGEPVRDDAGVIVRWFGTCTDIDDHKRVEAALRESDVRKDEFLAMLAHELRNPLGPVSNAARILTMVDPSDRLARQAREIIDRQVAHIARLVDDLLDVSRISRGRVQLRTEPCDLTTIAAESAEDYRPSVEANGVTLLVECDAATLPVEGDPTRLRQAVGNLVHNAIKFTASGGRIIVRTETQPGGYGAVSVEDTGIGLDPAVLEAIFEPFVQLDRSLDRSPGGLGLGLALVRGLVELHRGEVEAASDGPGRGATFTFRIPLVQPAPMEVAPMTADTDNVPLRVLVVEDNEDAAESLRLLLSLSGHQVEVAFDGPGALALVESMAPQVVLCDVGLPRGMDGYEVARRIRGTPAHAAIRLVAVTGYGQDEDVQRALDAGFDQHLVKPVDFDKLKAALPHTRTADRR